MNGVPLQEACQRGIALFDAQRFFEAHECFEYVWKAEELEARAASYLRSYPTPH